jgi:glucosyl-dolichyl phosphate glucuronosyltransferase
MLQSHSKDVDASIIICTHNRCVDLEQTLRALSGVAVPDTWRVELIIVDNGSTDETRFLVASAHYNDFELQYVEEPRRGQVMARNAGIARAQGQIIIFIDDDVRPKSDWLVELVRPIRAGRCDVSVGTVRIPPHLLRPWMTDLHLTWLASREGIEAQDPRFVTGANFAFSRAVLQKIPRFDPELGPGRLGFWDDTLFSLQLQRANYRLSFAPRAIVEHHFDRTRLSRRSFLARARGEGRSIAYVAWHWDHSDMQNTTLLAWRKRLRLQQFRLTRARECRVLEGCAMWEMSLVQQIGLFSQYARERKRPRAYERHGLRKLLPPQ